MPIERGTMEGDLLPAKARRAAATCHGEARSVASAATLWITLLTSVWSGVVSGETVRFAHCLGGCPGGAPSDNVVIARAIYTLSFNPDRQLADWVAYLVTAGSIGVATNLSRAPEPDPLLGERGVSVAAGLIAAGAQELNYFAPLVSFAGTPYWAETNYLTNRVPRSSDLNRGSWYGLEWAVRNLANRTAGLYVITGPVYDEPAQEGLPGGADAAGAQLPALGAVPGGFFKVVADESGSAAAFLFPQSLPFHVHHCEQLTTLEEVERLTGLDLFPESPQLPLTDLSERLGCFR